MGVTCDVRSAKLCLGYGSADRLDSTIPASGLRRLAGLTKENVDWQGHRIMIALRDGLEMSVRTIQRIVRVLSNRAQISRKVSPHVLRHTFSVTGMQKGITKH
jgi:site-specific recombinase XerD